MTDDGYGLWMLVVFNSLLFIIFAASFFHPLSRRDWRVLAKPPGRPPVARSTTR